MKISGSRSARIRELYKKTVSKVKTSGTQGSKAVDAVSSKKTAAKDGVAAAGTRGTKGVSGAQYDDVLAKLEARTEEFACQAIAKAPDVRKARVDAIAKAIENGTYTFDADAVAERLAASGLFDDLE
ncbi:MAG: flagellar biosynthesis anti-sigma factor FlgM [Candidatus Riflebacteria bacterium]|nr:flagellar biosynthesis anti-sigma factor FlgM [Candidatus Riflebacteria bacterium]